MPRRLHQVIQATATNYHEWTWQLSRQWFWRDLATAYWDTGNEKYAAAFVSQMVDWVRDNPVPTDKAVQSPLSRWRTIEAGIRMGQTWPDAWYRFLGSPSFTDEAIIVMLKSFIEHARYLLKHPTTGNWLTMEANGLYHVGALFPEFKEAANWRKTAITRLRKELDNQVYPDGAQVELSTHYHQVSLSNFVWAMQIAQLNNYPVPPEYLAKLERMYDYNLYASMPNGQLPGLSDANAIGIRDSLAEAYRFFPNRKDFQYVATAGAEGIAPSQTSYAFPYAGQLVMRSGWEPQARYLLLDAGPFGYGHQHNDKLSFVIAAYGKYLLIDAGNYHYDSSPWRRYVLSSRAHNVIHVDGKEQRRDGLNRQDYIVKEPHPYRWETSERYDYASASFGRLEHERFGPNKELPAVHTRHILYVKDTPPPGTRNRDYWLVADVLEPTDDKPHLYEAMFHLDVNEVSVTPDTRRVVTQETKGANLAIIPAEGMELGIEVIKGQEEPCVQGWMSGQGYQMKPIPTAVFKRQAAGVACMIYVFCPIAEGTTPLIRSVEAVSVETENIRVRIRFEDDITQNVQVAATVSVQQTGRP